MTARPVQGTTLVMAGRNANSSKTSLLQRPGLRSLGPIWQWIRRLAFGLAALAAFGVLVYAVVPVPVTPYMVAERVRLLRVEGE